MRVRTKRKRRPLPLFWHILLITAGLAAIALLTLPDMSHQWESAQAAHARLDQELQRARHELGIPETMLAPIVRRERQTTANLPLWVTGTHEVAITYATLYDQLLGMEQQSLPVLRQRTDTDLQTLTLLLNTRLGEGMPGLDRYQATLDQAAQQERAATIPGDYAAIDAAAQTQNAALRAMEPTYQQLERFKEHVRALDLAGVPSVWGAATHTRDLQMFQQASTADQYTQLSAIIDGQSAQLLADETLALHTNGPALLRAFQQQIDRLRHEGGDAQGFQRAHDQEATLLAAATAPADYLRLAQAFDQQVSALALPLLRGQAHQDLAALQRLIAVANTHATIDPATGQSFPAAYEYSAQDPSRGGLASVEATLATARTADDFQQVDGDIHIQLTNLQALLDNLSDPTAHSRVHRTDLRLLQTYGLMDQKVIVLSLREQTVRFYDKGQLVNWSLVTTGRPERPTPPGVHTATQKLSPTYFSSSEPPDSPLWVPTLTPIKYAIQFYPGGFYLHDGWWRNRFGPGTNLPHHEPAAFNGGSHGCINFPPNVMPWVYNWTSLGTAVVIY